MSTEKKVKSGFAGAARTVQSVSADSVGSMVVCEFRHATTTPEALASALTAHNVPTDYVVAVRTVESAFVRGCQSIMDGNYLPPMDKGGKVKGSERKALKRAFRSLPVVEDGSVMTMSIVAGSKANAADAEVAHFARIAFDRSTMTFSSTVLGGAGTDEHDVREFLSRAVRASDYMRDAAGSVDSITARRGLWYYLSAKLGAVQLTQGACFLPNLPNREDGNPVEIGERLKAVFAGVSNSQWSIYTIPIYRGTDGHRLAADSATAELVTRIEALHERVREFAEAGKARPDSMAAVARDWQALDTDANLLESLLGVAVDHVRVARAEAERTLREIADANAARPKPKRQSAADRKAELAAQIAAESQPASAPTAEPVAAQADAAEPEAEPEADPVEAPITEPTVESESEPTADDTADASPAIIPVDDSGMPIEGAAPMKRAKAAPAPKAISAAKPKALPPTKPAAKAKAKAKA